MNLVNKPAILKLINACVADCGGDVSPASEAARIETANKLLKLLKALNRDTHRLLTTEVEQLMQQRHDMRAELDTLRVQLNMNRPRHAVATAPRPKPPALKLIVGGKNGDQ